MLTIEVEFLTGVARLANDRGDGPDWPPQPDRLFSALVATWAARGAAAEERAALEWLEAAPPPAIEASACHGRGVVRSYVPPNDDAAASNKRQERRFPAVIPVHPVVRFTWPEAPSPAMREALAALARDTSYLGHSASLVRCAVVPARRPDQVTPARRRLYRGRLSELERRFAAGQRPSPGASLPAPAATGARPPASVFGADWIVFADAGGFRPDALAAPIAAKALLRAVQAGFAPAAAPEWISGHTPDGGPSRQPHLAAVPLLDAGWHWSRGRFMGLALVLPRALEAAARRARDPDAGMPAADALAAEAEEQRLHEALARLGTDHDEDFAFDLRLPGGRVWRLRHDPAPVAASLRPARYAAIATRWASVTPIVLDRHPKAPGDAEAAVATACTRIGLPRPAAVVLAPHAAIVGAPGVQGAARRPWTRWRLPESLRGRPLTHAVITFAEVVQGPVLLGAGRFCGLGLCLPLEAAGTP